MKKVMPFILFFGVLAGLALGGCGKPTETSDSGVRFESADCKFDTPFNPKIECGNLFVPEDRNQPDSPMIQIHVAIIKSNSKQPAPDPIVILGGGPGGYTVGGVNYWINIFESARKDRDLIIFDQRGVGYSEPELNCPEMEEQFYQYQAQDISLEEEIQLDTRAAQACHDRLVGEGVNLAAYTSAANAADVNDLRLALGYTEWNLYGGSYGTRLALTVMRDFPQGIRSVILDSVCLPQADHYAELASNVERAFNLLFERCAAHPRCAEAFPDLQTVFYEVVARLDEQPVTLSFNRPDTGERADLVMNGRRLVGTFFSLLYSTGDIPGLPKLIYEIYNDRWGEFNSLIQWTKTSMEYLSEGMWISVDCGEEAQFSSPEAVELANTPVNPVIREAMVFGPYFSICSLWDASAAPKVESKAVSSDIPTLIFMGELDPIHPPAWGVVAAKTLSKSQYFEFPNYGHGVLGEGSDGGNCSQKILDAFLSDPAAEVDASCIGDLKPFFLTR